MKTKQKNSKNSVKKATTKLSARRVAVVKTKAKSHAKKMLVPHKANQYRPHLIRWQAMTIVLAVALVAQLAYGFVSTGQVSVLGRVSEVTTAGLLADTNIQREQQGVTGLALDDRLSQAAFYRAQDMFENNYWAHVSPTGVQPWKWFADVGYNYSYAGENLAKNYATSNATVAAWMDSASHRENLLNGNYSEVGFAVVDGQLNGENTTLVVALYGAPVTTAALGVSDENREGSFSAAPVNQGGVHPFQYFASAAQSMNPVTAVSLLLLALIALIAAVAHHYRYQLPKAWRKSWKVHHGMYTFIGVLVAGALIILASGTGQI